MHSLWIVVLSWMVAIAPASKWRARFVEVSVAIADASTERPLYAGDLGSLRTAALLTSIAWYESTFSPAAVGPGGEVGLWQIHPSHHLDAAILRDPARAAPIAREELRRSRRECSSLPERRQLALYTSGDCSRGWRESEHRLDLAYSLAGD